jgi:hypothetical protein
MSALRSVADVLCRHGRRRVDPTPKLEILLLALPNTRVLDIRFGRRFINNGVKAVSLQSESDSRWVTCSDLGLAQLNPSTRAAFVLTIWWMAASS